MVNAFSTKHYSVIDYMHYLKEHNTIVSTMTDSSGFRFTIASFFMTWWALLNGDWNFPPKLMNENFIKLYFKLYRAQWAAQKQFPQQNILLITW